jgi:hypothetical protein
MQTAPAYHTTSELLFRDWAINHLMNSILSLIPPSTLCRATPSNHDNEKLMLFSRRGVHQAILAQMASANPRRQR